MNCFSAIKKYGKRYLIIKLNRYTRAQIDEATAKCFNDACTSYVQVTVVESDATISHTVNEFYSLSLSLFAAR